MRKSIEQTLGQAIEAMLSSYRLKDKYNEVKLVECWDKVMGKVIAKRTREIYIKDKKLFLTIDSAPLKEELRYAKDKVIVLLNEAVGEKVIEDIVIG